MPHSVGAEMKRKLQLGLIKNEVAARVGAIATGTTTVVPWIDQLSVWLKIGSTFIGVCVGLATFAYYVPLAIEKWRQVLAKKKS
jgi:hypothetical protein